MTRINPDLLRREGVRIALHRILINHHIPLDDVFVSIPATDADTYTICISGSLLNGSFTIDRNTVDDRSIQQALFRTFPELAI